ncbi:MAG: hypothetical protein H7832_02400 [Magnetococcus sp. DMHC-6]
MQSPKVLTLLFVQALVHRPHLNVVVPKIKNKTHSLPQSFNLDLSAA